MKRAAGLVDVVLIACLAVVPALPGCSKSSSNDGGTTDSGEVEDGGTEDAGIDAGVAIDPHGLGMACAPANDEVANCSRGLECVPLSPTNMCTVLGCEEAFDGGATPTTNPCGETETGIQNICIPFSNTEPADSACARGCDPTLTTSSASGPPCYRSDYSCWSEPDSSNKTCTTSADCSANGDYCVGGSCSIGFCWPDCRTAGNGCGYGSSCDMSTGECNVTQCGTGQAACSTGDVCWTDDTQSPPESSCVPDCRNADGGLAELSDGGDVCPPGRTCNTMGGCDEITTGVGGLCGTDTAACTGNSSCLDFSQNAANGECVLPCATDSDCTVPGTYCTIALENGTKVCTPVACDGGTVSCGPDAGAGFTCTPLNVNVDGGPLSLCIPM